MSLVNRMLKDLSARGPAPADVLVGTRIHLQPEVPQASPLKRLGGLLLIVAVALAGLWWQFGPRKIPVPQPRQAVTGAPSATPAPPAVSAVAVDDRTGLKMATLLAATPAGSASVPADHPPVTEKALVDDSPAKRESRGAPAASAPARPRPPDPAPGPSTVDVVANEAQIARMIGEGRLDEAADLLARTHAGAPGWVAYRRLAARIDLGRDRPQRVLELLEPDAPPLASDPEYFGLLASAYQRLGKHREAARVYQQLVQAQPEQAHWWAGYGISIESLGNRDDALSAYRQALGLGGLDPRVAQFLRERIDALQGPGR